MNPVTYEDASHVYTDACGKRLPSVTTIIREVFQTGSFGHSPESRFRGEAVHRACQLISEGRYVEERVHEVIRPFARAWRAYVLDCGYVSSQWEIPLASRFGYAGKLDTLGLLPDGSMVLLDIKSGVAPKWVAIQLAAYKMLIRENFGYHDIKSRAIQLQSSGNYKIFTGININGHGFVPFDDARFDTFWSSCLNVYLSGLLKTEDLLG